MSIANHCVFAILYGLSTWNASQPQEPNSQYTIPVNVEEVNLTFSVTDENGRWIDGLQLSDMRLKDNGRAPLRILSFQGPMNLPVRAGILVDTSRSMLHALPRNRRIVSALAAHVLRTSSDQAFVMRFDFESKIRQDWTGDAELLNASMSDVAKDWQSRLGGTAIFDSVYRACRDQFGWTEANKAGNFILLFSDGIDNKSHARFEDVIDRCQRSHTAIYVFSEETKPSRDAGQKMLQQLAAKSGGRIFYDQEPDAQLKDLREIEGDARYQYQLVYKPANLKPDGSFHLIKLDCPFRAAIVHVREGYYSRR
jgi:Ca-activated chloride channel homolog